MAPSRINEDYYRVLELNQTATAECIKKSYRRLAWEIHPDRNAKAGSTQAFQLLGLAYETLKDETKRREYDIIYPFIRQTCGSSQSTQSPRAPAASAEHSEIIREAAQIAALRKSKEGRDSQWRISRQAFEWSISDLRRSIQRLEQDIGNLASIAAAEAASEARKNSWTTWFLSPLYKQLDESEVMKAHKARKKQERRIEKDLKERRLSSEQIKLRSKQSLFEQAKKDIDAADLRDDKTIRAIDAKARDREARKRQAEARAAESARQEENRRRQMAFLYDILRRPGSNAYFNLNDGNTGQSHASACSHHGWWNKVHIRTACPECYDVWNFLLQCPSCNKKACPKCQSRLRPGFQRHTARPNRSYPVEDDW